MKNNITKFVMEYRRISLPAIKIVGIGVSTSMSKASADCPKVWGRFMSKCEQIKNQKEVMVSFGVSTQVNAENCTMRYTAGSEVNGFNEVPDGMEKIELPESEYFVFTHKGKLNILNKTYGDITETMQKSGEKQKDFWLEKYDYQYKGDSDDSEFQILIPVVTK